MAMSESASACFISKNGSGHSGGAGDTLTSAAGLGFMRRGNDDPKIMRGLSALAGRQISDFLVAIAVQTRNRSIP